MKTFKICNILEDRVRTEDIAKDPHVSTGHVYDEVLNKLDRTKSFNIHSKEGAEKEAALIRYIRVTPI
jgi:hypothetical protein